MQRAALCVGRMLQQNRIARQQRWDTEAHGLPQGKVPGHDSEDRAEWEERDVALDISCRGWLIREHTRPMFRIPLCFMSTLLYLGLCLRDGLAHLGGDHLR